MKQSILKIGTALDRRQQKQINGGSAICPCTSNYTQTSPNECQFRPKNGFGMCVGVIVNGLCCISGL